MHFLGKKQEKEDRELAIVANVILYHCITYHNIDWSLVLFVGGGQEMGSIRRED